MKHHRLSTSTQANTRGFSLVEMLTVLAIVGILSAISVPAIQSINQGSDAANATIKLTTFLDQARQYATANNTYVYISVLSDTSTNDVRVAAVASKDGTDVASTLSLGNNADLLSRVLVLKGMTTANKDAVSITTIPRPNPVDSVAVIDEATGAPATVTIGSGANQKTYPVSFWFGPQGTASSNAVPPTRLEMAIVPESKTQNGSFDSNWASVIQISGLTGTIQVYRAQ